MAKAEVQKSVFRVISDLIKSDNIITVDELNGLEETCKKYGIERTNKEAGYKITLSQAARIISQFSDNSKKKFLRTLEEIALKDGECCREESLLITAFDMICNNKNAEIISMELSNRPLLTTQILYLEDKITNTSKLQLETNYDEIKHIAKTGGLELIYIPQVAKHFRSYDINAQKRNDLKRLFQLISPTSLDSDIENCITAMQGMSTKYFLNTVLNEYLDMRLHINNPSWLIRLTDSVVDGIGYANYLRFDVEKDLKQQLISVIENINQHLGPYSIIVNDGREKEHNFHYNGFYKALLDVMSIKRIEKWDLHIRLYGEGAEPYSYLEDNKKKKCVMTIRKGIEEYPIAITGRDVAFYTLLLCFSLTDSKGIDFHDASLKKVVQEVYVDIYHKVSRRDSDIPNAWIPESRIPMRARINSAINSSVIANHSSLQHLYTPTDLRQGYIQIPVEPDKVYIDSENKSERLINSRLFNDFIVKYKEHIEK